MLYMVFFLLGGAVLLYFGAEFLIKGSTGLALRFGISPLVVGLTVVAFGTSAPELVVSIKAGCDGLGDIALGNVIGSNIFNIAVILGISALVRPLKVNTQVLRIDTPIMVGISALCILLLKDRSIERTEAVLLFCGIVAYTAFTVILGKRDFLRNGAGLPAEPPCVPKGSYFSDALRIAGGLGGLVIGSRLFVKGAIDLAHLLQVSEAVIGLTIVAMGTSLPELATSVVAALRKQEDIAIGNIVGSNMFNMMAILGISGMLTPLTSQGIGMVDLGFMLGISVILLPFMKTGCRINQIEGGILLAMYGAYLVYLWPK